MTDEKTAVTEVKVKSENERQFNKKKINRFNVLECKQELARLENVNDKYSEYFFSVKARSMVAER